MSLKARPHACEASTRDNTDEISPTAVQGTHKGLPLQWHGYPSDYVSGARSRQTLQKLAPGRFICPQGHAFRDSVCPVPPESGDWLVVSRDDVDAVMPDTFLLSSFLGGCTFLLRINIVRQIASMRSRTTPPIMIAHACHGARLK